MKARPVLSSQQRQIIDKESRRIFLEWMKEHEYDIDKIVLWTLHKYYGWGAVRLKKFWRLMVTSEAVLKEMYELDEVPTDFLCDISLESCGVNVEKWAKELDLERNKGL